MPEEEKKQILLHVPARVHAMLRTLAAMEGRTLKEEFMRLVEKAAEEKQVKVFVDSEEGE